MADKIFASKIHTITRRFETLALADSLAKNGTFADPFQFKTGPSAHLSPAFPSVLAILTTMFPVERDYKLAKELLSSIATALQYALLPVLAVALGFSLRVGIIAALLPPGILSLLPRGSRTLETQGSWEHTYTALGLVLLTLVATKTILRPNNFTPKTAALFGLSWGFYLLWLPTMAVLYPAWLLIGWITCPAGNRAIYRNRCLLATATLAATIAPWSIRNYYALGAPVLIRSNLGLELHVSNNDCAKANFAEMLPCHYQTHPNGSPQVAREMLAAGEAPYNAMLLTRAMNWITTNPGRFARLTAERFLLFWFPPYGKGSDNYPLWAVTLLGFVGLGLCLRRNPQTGALIGSALLLYPLIYYAIQHFTRYRYPILWISTLLAAFALEQAWMKYRRA